MHWSEVYFVGAFAAYVAIRAHYERRVSSSPPVVEVHASMERLLLAVMALGAVGLPAAHLLTPWLRPFDYAVPPLISGAGAVVSLGALWLFWRAHADLDTAWSRTMAIKAGQRLVTRGVYRRVRHPMYAAIWLFSLSQACLLHNIVAGWSAIVAFTAMYAFRVPREEQLMRQQFGDAYVEYCRTAGRLWPRLGRTT